MLGPTSGLDSGNCDQSDSTSGEGTNLMLNTSCQDLAGNSNSDSKTFKVDKTAPTISAVATAAPTRTS